MAQTLKITVTAVPKPLTKRFVRVERIISDVESVEFLEKMKPFLFGADTMGAAELLELDLFTLLFVYERPFLDYIKRSMEKVSEGAVELARLGLLVNLLYNGKAVRLIPLHKEKSEVFVSEAVLLRLNIIDSETDYKRINKRLSRAADKNDKKGFNPVSSVSSHYFDTIHLAVTKLYMKQALSEKELLDKMNYRRFNAHLRLNTRPISPEELNNILKQKKLFPDISDSNERLNLTILYAVACRGVKAEELFDADRIFTVGEDSERFSRFAGDFLDIIYNGNGVEITDVFVKMAEALAGWEMPKIKGIDLVEIRKSYTYFYGGTALAYSFDRALCSSEKMKALMRKRMITNYWSIYERILRLKQYSSIITLCHTLSELDVNMYRDLPACEEKLVLAFGEAERAIEEINR